MVYLFGTFAIKFVVEQVEKGADVNLVNKSGEAPLEFTTCLGVVKILVENGATGISQGLHFPAQNSKLEVLDYLLEKGAEINTKRNYDGKTALHLACQFGYLDIVTYLTEKNADLVNILKTFI
jgi:ankyrin repeat protein